VHVALDAKLTVRFDRPLSPDKLTLSIDPPAAGKPSWPDPQTFVFEPASWHDGKRHTVRIESPGVEPVTFQFTTLAPPPARVEPGGGARITLTFDDGASDASHVTRLLDLLEKEDIDAIFFPTGYWAETHPRLIERIRRDGHRVCNHTYSHPRLPQLADDAVRKEIAKGAGAGTCPLFRPPMRAYDPRIERIVAEMGYTMYLWDIDSRDWEGLPAEDMVHRILKRARPGAVVLFHMHAAETLKALPALIPRLRKAGYVLRDPPDAGAP
jgi:peptidoglycan/xylan/chitin deacetylase (PgdA/CDA1 family)